MLKQALITSALLLGSTSQLSATPCETYGSESWTGDITSFYCSDNSSSKISASASYTLDFDNYDDYDEPGSDTIIYGGDYENSDNQQNIGYCINSTDRTCESTQPDSISTGKSIYVKNTTETNDYFRAYFNSYAGFSNVEAHIPPDSNATLEKSSTITEPVNLPSTADTTNSTPFF